MKNNPLFQSFIIAGFECSTHQYRDRKRLDVVQTTKHDIFALPDYHRLKTVGIRTAREGLRWHLIEEIPGVFDFRTLFPIIKAAQSTNTQVIWDICHFGWPDHLDVMKPEWIDGIAKLAGEFAKFLRDETTLPPFFVPVNEISYLSYIGGEEGKINPYLNHHGEYLKKQLVLGAIAATEAIWEITPEARIMHVDPIINIIAHPERPMDKASAEFNRLLQYQAWDMLAGRMFPELGGNEKYLDILGLNYYMTNQWYYDLDDGIRSHRKKPLTTTHPLYRPLREIVAEVHARYKRPMFIAETGAEDENRGPWLQYVGEEIDAAIRSGIPIHGITLYPILNHPGWEDDRHCHNGLWDYPDDKGQRDVCVPLLQEMMKIQFAHD